MSELTKEYFEGYLEAKLDEKLAKLATKKDVEELAQMTSQSFVRVEGRFDNVESRLASVETRLGGVETSLGKVEVQLGVVEENVKGFRVDIAGLDMGQDKIKRRLDRFVLDLEAEEYEIEKTR